MSNEHSSMFKGTCILIFPALIGKKRMSLFETHIRKGGGNLCQFSDMKKGTCKPSHFVVEDSLLQNPANLEKTLKTYRGELKAVVGTQWLSDCIKLKMLVPTESYQVHFQKQSHSEECSTSKRAKLSSESETGNISKKITQDDKFAGSQSSSALTTAGEGNEIIIQELQKLADAFRNKGDTWRSHGYNKAISAIKRCGKVLSCYEDAIALPGLSDKMARKVWEILETGSLKVSKVCEDSKTIALEIFTNIWGVGPSTAENWYQQGYRTLADVKEKVCLTKQQMIGLKYYEDFLQRIPRKEVEEIALIVSSAAKTIEPLISPIPVGSYRRGNSSCGDVDIMICIPDHLNSKSILSQLIISLKGSGLITDDLVTLEKEGNQRKYLGVCCLPGDRQKHRRLDIFVVPKSEEATALMHYTGSALFNRSIRLLAAKKGFSLSEHCLNGGVLREGLKVLNSGYIIPTPNEESIFKALDLEYRPPEERDH
ncbi:DNA polymerase lambda [Frankliniella fusca]|uniref:DNA polymerase n=1 Tax=Frankliniella fusca TaxID=407009 RepID=A0AAE1GZA7_9NEOP|nr:DNA polymerase lambda [Frankliniella fusca]